MPLIVGNDSWLRTLAFTAREFDAQEALKNGFLSGVFESRDALEAAATTLASAIASKSPVAIGGTKAMLNYSRGRPVAVCFASFRKLT
jgi:Delta3,5-Delta2,4-dienoyl-CoA isomerase